MDADRDGLRTCLRQPSGELAHGQEVCELGRRVGLARVVATPFVEQVGCIEVRAQRSEAAHRDHPRAGAPSEQWQQERGEREVPQVIDGHVELVAVLRPLFGLPHDRSVVDEDIEPVDPDGDVGGR